MSNRGKNSDNILAGAVTVGVGVLAGLAYAGYQWYSSANSPAPPSTCEAPTSTREAPPSTCRELPSTNGAPPSTAISQPRVDSNETTVRHSPQSVKKCVVCSRVIKENEEFTLTCQHSFHMECICAQYILCSDTPPFRCPEETCKKIVSDAEDKKIIGMNSITS